MAIRELREARQKKYLEARNLVDTHTGDQWTPEIDTKYNALLTEIDNLDAEIQRHQKVLDETAQTLARAHGVNSDGFHNSLGGMVQDRTYRGMFGNTRISGLDNGEWKSKAEFMGVVYANMHDPRLIRASMTSGTGSSGGFSVPEEFSSTWLDNSLPTEIIRPRCQVWPMTSDTRKIPGWDDLDQSSGAMFGGFKMEFLAEEQTGAPQSGKLRLMTLAAKKGAIYAEVSNELLADGLGFESQLDLALQGSIRYGFDNAFLTGTGAGQPIGILNSSSVIEVPKETGQAADTILYQNFSKLWARMYSAGRQRACWIMNDTIIPQLLELSVPVGTGGSHVPVLQESNGTYSIFGRPVLFSPIMPTLGNRGDISFVDLSQYAIGLRKEMAIERSMHAGFLKDTTWFRVIVRFDGQPTWSKVYTPQNGDAQSWAVVLESR